MSARSFINGNKKTWKSRPKKSNSLCFNCESPGRNKYKPLAQQREQSSQNLCWLGLQEKWQAFQKQQQAEDREGSGTVAASATIGEDRATLGQQEQQQSSGRAAAGISEAQLLQQQRLRILEHPDPKALEQEQLSQLQACQEKQVASRRSF